MPIERSNCAICGSHGVDVRINCGCLIHAVRQNYCTVFCTVESSNVDFEPSTARNVNRETTMMNPTQPLCLFHFWKIEQRCLPVASIIKEEGLAKHDIQPVAPGEYRCPACKISPVTNIQVLPLNIAELERAVEMRKSLSREMASKTASDDSTDQGLAEAQAEASYLLLSHGNSTAALCTDNEYQRTGRWTDDEMTYTNFVIEAFDEGKLIIENRLKLNEFLSDVLLCKTSRLTKKMKNARLSTRSYEFRYPVPSLDVQMFSSLEQKFLQSIASEPSRIEVHFNLHKHWRSQLCNLCHQIGSSLLDNQEWITSLQEIERRSIEAEEKIRQARRKRVGLSICRDSGACGAFCSDMGFSPGTKKMKIESRQDFANSDVSVSNATQGGGGAPVSQVTSSSETGSMSFEGASSENFNNISDRIVKDPGLPAFPKRINNRCGPFLEEIIGYVESLKIPFHHVDVWVPSYTADDNGGEDVMRLFHAGHVTKSDLDNDTYSRMTEFGEYSKTFSFGAEEDLPGRVFSTLKPRWVRKLDEADPSTYARSEGAKMYGMKTAFGFALNTAVVDRIIVCVYSTTDVPENPFLVSKFQHDLAKLCPEPKWKLVVEMGAAARAVAPSRNVQSCADKVLVVRDSSSSISSQIDEDILLEYRLANLLGEHMPDVDGNSENPISLISSESVPHFMSLRLLLLTPVDQRSDNERKMIDLLRKSFNQYSSDKNRCAQDLAYLAVKEWQYLQSGFGTALN